MSGINLRRVVLGGLVAGLVANVFDFVITTYVMAAEFNAMLAKVAVGEAAARSWIPVFAVGDFLWGFLLVFTYAAIRPRFGRGPASATIAAVMMWLALVTALLILVALGLHTPLSYAKSAGLYLLSAVGSSIAGAVLYRE